MCGGFVVFLYGVIVLRWVFILMFTLRPGSLRGPTPRRALRRGAGAQRPPQA